MGEGHPGRWSGWYGEEGGVIGAGGVSRAAVGKSGRWEDWAGEGEVEGGGGEGGGVFKRAGFSTYHIRRGDFQYKRVRTTIVVIFPLVL